MDSQKDTNVNIFRIPTTKHFFKGGSVKLSKGLTLWLIDGECREMGRENKEVGAMPTCYCLTFVLPAVSSQLSVFLKLCIINTLLHFLLLLRQ